MASAAPNARVAVQLWQWGQNTGAWTYSYTPRQPWDWLWGAPPSALPTGAKRWSSTIRPRPTTIRASRPAWDSTATSVIRRPRNMPTRPVACTGRRSEIDPARVAAVCSADPRVCSQTSKARSGCRRRVHQIRRETARRILTMRCAARSQPEPKAGPRARKATTDKKRGPQMRALSLVSHQPRVTTGPLPSGALPIGALPIGALPTGAGGGGALTYMSAAAATPARLNSATVATMMVFMGTPQERVQIRFVSNNKLTLHGTHN